MLQCATVYLGNKKDLKFFCSASKIDKVIYKNIYQSSTKWMINWPVDSSILSFNIDLT